MEDVLLHTVPLDDQPMDVDIHPTQRLLASGVIDGHLVLHDFTDGSLKQRHKVKAHATSCRAVRFSGGGELLYTASTDCSILAVDAASGQAQARKKDAHDSAINRLATVSTSGLASGDDEGVVKLWDARQSDAIASLEAHSDYVADLCALPDACYLLSVSGDGTLAVIDLRKNKIIAQSEGEADDELLSVAVVKGGTKVVCGSTSGVLGVWSWGFWNDCSDRFPGHPESVTALLRYDEDSILTGSSDGLIRVLSIQPNKMLGVLGEHSDYPIERLSMSADRSVLASASHDNTVKLWDLSQLADDGDDEDEGGDGEEEEEEEAGEDAAQAAAGKDSGEGAQAGDESGADGEEEEESGEEQSSEGEPAAASDRAAAAAAAAAAEAAAARGSGPAATQQQGAGGASAGGAAKPAASSDDSDSEEERGKKQRKRRQKGQHRIQPKKGARHTGGNFFSGIL